MHTQQENTYSSAKQKQINILCSQLAPVSYNIAQTKKFKDVALVSWDIFPLLNQKV